MNRLPFWIYPVVLLLGSAALALWFPLPAHYRDSLADVYSLAPTPAAGLMYGALLLLLFAACWLAARRPPAGLRLWHVLTIGLLLGLPALLTYPINANDIFRYLLRGRVTAIYGANPYLTAPGAFPNDPYAGLAGEWANAASPYGPLWEMIDALVVLATGGRLLAALLLFKLIGLAALLLGGWLLAQSVTPANRLRVAILWTWNPALLLMFVVDGHNDALMLCLLLAGVWLMARQPLAGLLLMALGALVKPIGVLPALLYGVWALRAAPTWQARLRLALTAPPGALALAALAFWPFGGIGALLTRLLSEATDGGGFSLLAWLYFLDQRLALPFALFDFGWVTVAGGLFGVAAVALLLATLAGRPPARAAAELYYLYLLSAFNFRIWYTTWIFPWTLLDDDAPRLRAAYTLLVTSQLSVVWYTHARRVWLAGDPGVAHLIGVPLILIAPLLWLLHGRRNAKGATL